MPRRIIQLEDLEQGFASFSPRKAAAHAEASFYCLAAQSHETGVEMQIQGSFTETMCVAWDYELTEQVIGTWRENIEATDEGACGIALLLMTRLTDYNDINRAWHTTGVDYYLCYEGSEEPFQNAAKLEVSGIRKARNKSEVKQRVKQKLAQTNASDDDGLPVYVVVVEFTLPLSQVVKK